jgi:hypothetical protein
MCKADKCKTCKTDAFRYISVLVNTRPCLLRCAIAFARHNERQIFYFTCINTCSPSAKKVKLLLSYRRHPQRHHMAMATASNQTNNDALLKFNRERHWLYFACINILTNEITSLVQLLIWAHWAILWNVMMDIWSPTWHAQSLVRTGSWLWSRVVPYIWRHWSLEPEWNSTGVVRVVVTILSYHFDGVDLTIGSVTSQWNCSLCALQPMQLLGIGMTQG